MSLLKQDFNFRKILFLGLTLNNFTSMAFVVLQEENKTLFYLFSTVTLYTVTLYTVTLYTVTLYTVTLYTVTLYTVKPFKT